MNPIDDWIRTGDLDGGVSALVEQVRKDPANLRTRMRLFQAYTLSGDWEGAACQLRLLQSLSRGDQDLLLGVPAYLNLIAAERLRASVFLKGNAPVFFGEPAEWMGLQLEAVRQGIGGKWLAALELIERSREAAPAISGRLDGQAFEWIMDADPRLGPLLVPVWSGFQCPALPSYRTRSGCRRSSHSATGRYCRAIYSPGTQGLSVSRIPVFGWHVPPNGVRWLKEFRSAWGCGPGVPSPGMCPYSRCANWS